MILVVLYHILYIYLKFLEKYLNYKKLELESPIVAHILFL